MPCPGECLIPKLLNSNHIVQVIEYPDFLYVDVRSLRWST